jgi:hypothetical protein
MRTVASQWAAGVSAEMTYAVDPKLQKQVTAAAEGNVPFMVVLGENELDGGFVQVKDMRSRTASLVPRSDVVAAVKALGATVIGATGHAERSEAASTVRAPALTPAALALTPPPAPVPAAAAAAATHAATAAPVSRSNGGTIGVTKEGVGRPAGRFVRPADM